MEMVREEEQAALDFLAECGSLEAFKYQVTQRELITNAIFGHTGFRRIKINCMIPQRT